jgi:hypothetical protein
MCVGPNITQMLSYRTVSFVHQDTTFGIAPSLVPSAGPTTPRSCAERKTPISAEDSSASSATCSACASLDRAKRGANRVANSPTSVAMSAVAPNACARRPRCARQRARIAPAPRRGFTSRRPTAAKPARLHREFCFEAGGAVPTGRCLAAPTRRKREWLSTARPRGRFSPNCGRPVTAGGAPDRRGRITRVG